MGWARENLHRQPIESSDSTYSSASGERPPKAVATLGQSGGMPRELFSEKALGGF